MNNYYKYLPISGEDEKWGINVLDAGCTRIHPSEDYPDASHPMHHYFNWSKGRTLQEYQVIYITKGEGIFESKSCPQTKINEGTIILLFPDEWHRYRPDKSTGWDEYWIVFKGAAIQNIMKENFFHPANPLLTIGHDEKVLGILSVIIETTKYEGAGYQPLISGAVLHLLGYIYSTFRQDSFKQENQVEITVNKARIILRENSDKNISVETIAEELQVSYAWFRKAFKSYTGMAPGQYLIQLKIQRAKELLSNPSKSIKQIAYDMQFDSAFYFSRLFKEKTGVTPAQYRKKIKM